MDIHAQVLELRIPSCFGDVNEKHNVAMDSLSYAAAYNMSPFSLSLSLTYIYLHFGITESMTD